MAEKIIRRVGDKSFTSTVIYRMTKTEYKNYIASEGCKRTRKTFLEYNNKCNRCDLPRWLAIVAYDQDLNVHHKSYANLGNEPEADLEALCRRCHEIESNGHSVLHEVSKTTCPCCGESSYFDKFRESCEDCHMGIIEGFAFQHGKASVSGI